MTDTIHRYRLAEYVNKFWNKHPDAVRYTMDSLKPLIDNIVDNELHEIQQQNAALTAQKVKIYEQLVLPKPYTSIETTPNSVMERIAKNPNGAQVRYSYHKQFLGTLVEVFVDE